MDTQILQRKKELESELRRIKDIIIKEYSPEEIILFGSLANGNIHEWSDIDLVIIKETKERFIDRLHRVRLMTQPELGVDFVVYTPQEMEDMKREKRRFLLKEVLEKGEVIYERKEQVV